MGVKWFQGQGHWLIFALIRQFQLFNSNCSTEQEISKSKPKPNPNQMQPNETPKVNPIKLLQFQLFNSNNSTEQEILKIKTQPRRNPNATQTQPKRNPTETQLNPTKPTKEKKSKANGCNNQTSSRRQCTRTGSRFTPSQTIQRR